MADAVRHAIVNTDSMHAVRNDAGMRSFRFGEEKDGKLELLDIDNGNVVELKLPMLDRDVYTAVAPSSAKVDISKLALVTTPEIMYDERLSKNLWQFYNMAENDEPITGMLLHIGDRFSVTTEGLDAAATIAEGDVVELQSGKTMLKVVKTATANTTTIGKVIDIIDRRDGTYIGIEVG